MSRTAVIIALDAIEQALLQKIIRHGTTNLFGNLNVATGNRTNATLLFLQFSGGLTSSALVPAVSSVCADSKTYVECYIAHPYKSRLKGKNTDSGNPKYSIPRKT